ncbi:MAG: hypothetical protein EAZ55_05510 [Cytophagales bacterium]|nr:MAG: hypothetical protein EAZ55_05510 [Cytophagales bacterium]
MSNSLFLTKDGAKIENNGAGQVYWNNQPLKIAIPADLFMKWAGVVYAEAASTNLVTQLGMGDVATEMEREGYGIAVTMFNYCEAKSKKLNKNYTLVDLLSNADYAKALVSTQYQEYQNFSGGDANRRKYAHMGCLRVLLGNHIADIQQAKSLYWDGQDLWTNAKHFKKNYGFRVTRPEHGGLYRNKNLSLVSTPALRPDVQQKGIQYVYQSVFTAGGTIFSTLTPEGFKAYGV